MSDWNPCEHDRLQPTVLAGLRCHTDGAVAAAGVVVTATDPRWADGDQFGQTCESQPGSALCGGPLSAEYIGRESTPNHNLPMLACWAMFAFVRCRGLVKSRLI